MTVLVAFLVVLVDLGFGRLGYGLLLPSIRHDLGGTYATYGAIGAVHLGGYLVGTIASPWVLRDRRKLPRVTALAHGAIAIAFVWSALAESAVTLAAARTLLGLATGIGLASAIADALQRSSAGARGRTMAIAWSGIGAGLVLSAPVGVALGTAAISWRAVTLIGALPALAIVALALRLRPQPDAAVTTSVGNAFWAPMLQRRNVFYVTAYAFYGLAYIGFATFVVAAFAARGLSAGLVAATWGGFGLAAVIGTLATGRILDGPAQRWAMALSTLTGALGSLVTLAPSAVAAVGGALCVGFGFSAAPAVASAFARARSDDATYVRAFASVTAMFGIGQLVGPLVAGGVADAYGLDAVPALTAVLFGLGTAAALVDAVGRRQTA